MKKILIIIGLLFLTTALVKAMSISEIMYNPKGSDNNKEFIEIYGNGTDNNNLSNCIISDLEANDTLQLIKRGNKNYSLIVEEGFNHTKINCSIYSAGATIGNNLNNEGDSIQLHCNNNSVDEIAYNSTIGYNNGFSIEIINDSLFESCLIGGTPGKENCISLIQETSINETYNSTGNQTINLTTNLTTNNTTNNTVDSSTNITNNITKNITSNISKLCNISISIDTDKETYTSREKVIIKNELSNKENNFIITYWVEDLFNRTIKTPYDTANTNTKTYTPSITEEDKILIVKNKLSFVNCTNNAPLNQTSSEKRIIILNEQQNLGDESKISIEEIYLGSDEQAESGEKIKVKLDIWRGETGKSTLMAYVEDENGKKVSEETKFYLNKKNSQYLISIIVILDSKCEKEIKSGIHDLVIEGLDLVVRKSIEVETSGEKCKDGAKDNSKVTTNSETQIIGTQIKSNQKDLIKSFYTRAKKYSKEIKLYFNVNVSSEYLMRIISSDEKYELEIQNKGTHDIKVKPINGSNLFIAELIKIIDGKETIVSTKKLIFNLNKESDDKKENNTDIEKEIVYDYEAFLEQKPKKADFFDENNSQYKDNDITGNIIYQSKEKDRIKALPYILIGIIMLVAIGVFIAKKQR